MVSQFTTEYDTGSGQGKPAVKVECTGPNLANGRRQLSKWSYLYFLSCRRAEHVRMLPLFQDFQERRTKLERLEIFFLVPNAAP